MRKTTILAALFWAILGVCWLAACGNSSAETAKLQDQVNRLEAKVEDLEEKLTNQTGDDNLAMTGSEGDTNSAGLDTSNARELKAGSDQLTENDLLDLADKYMNDPRKGVRDSVVEQIISNKSTTGRVMERLAEAKYYSVAIKVAASNKANEQALTALAKIWRNSTTTLPGKYCRDVMARMILANPNANSAVADALAMTYYYDVAHSVALFELTSADTLCTLARIWRNSAATFSEGGNCRYYMAKTILANPNADSAVTSELMESEYSDVTTAVNDHFLKNLE